MARDITMLIEESLHFQPKGYRDRISFATDKMKEKWRILGGKHLNYNIKKCIKQGSFNIIHDISETFTLVQLMDSVDKINHAVIIVCCWIFDSNYEKALPLTLDSLNPRCSPSEGEGMFDMFKTLFHAFRYTRKRL